MSRKAALSPENVASLYQNYLNEAYEAKVSVWSGRSWELAAYMCFPEMGDAIAWSQAQVKKFSKQRKPVRVSVINRTTRRRKIASIRSRKA